MGIAIIIFVLATVPAIVLFTMTRKLDKKEKESPGLLVSIMLMEIPFLIATIIAEGLLQSALSFTTGGDMNNIIFVALYCFLIIGPAEEIFKLLGAKIPTWRSREFNCKFDGIVYCTTSALTFAFIENVMYVLTANGALITAIMRAVCCFPGHFMYGVIMGVFYSRAKIADNFGLKKKKNLNLFLAVLIPALIHGLYDTLCFSMAPLYTLYDHAKGSQKDVFMVEILAMFVLLILVIIGTYITLFITVIKQSKSDYYFAPAYQKPQKKKIVTGETDGLE